MSTDIAWFPDFGHLMAGIFMSNARRSNHSLKWQFLYGTVGWPSQNPNELKMYKKTSWGWAVPSSAQLQRGLLTQSVQLGPNHVSVIRSHRCDSITSVCYFDKRCITSPWYYYRDMILLFCQFLAILRLFGHFYPLSVIKSLWNWNFGPFKYWKPL